MTAQKEQWASRAGLVLAMAGNAVGLGNFLRFPAQAAQNGGGVFLIPYLVAFVLMGIPLLWVEWAIGRHGGKPVEHRGRYGVLGGVVHPGDQDIENRYWLADDSSREPRGSPLGQASTNLICVKLLSFCNSFYL